MVEIALSIAVVAFALVAIIGVLPTGLDVQKRNRDDTIINQETQYWLEAIRSGSKGLDELTNYVDAIFVSHRDYTRGDYLKQPFQTGLGYTNGHGIIGLLTRPKYLWLTNISSWSTSHVFEAQAYVRALAGPAVEKPDPRHPDTNEFAFSYRLTTQLTPVSTLPSYFTNITDTQTLNELSKQQRLDRTNQYIRSQLLAPNFYELSVTVEWPLYLTPKSVRVGNNRKTLRTMVAGTLFEDRLTNHAGPTTNRVYFVRPMVYQRNEPWFP